MKRITVVTPCYNEEENVEALFARVRDVFATLPGYEFEHLFIDNASTDSTVEVLRKMAAADPRVKVIVNSRNFGHIRSPYYGLLQGTGDAVISMVADLQDPPELITEFLKHWEAGKRIVVGVKAEVEESGLYMRFRKVYYRLVRKMADIELIENFTGFGLYDQSVIAMLRTMNDPYPYFRGLICELGFDKAFVPYAQPLRRKGITKNNFYTLYDLAWLGFVNHSKVPLRIATFAGFSLAAFSIFIAFVYALYKLLFWDQFSVGTAPVVIGLFLLSGVQLIFVGIIGEYVGAIYTQVKGRPLVIEKERINFKA